MRTNQNVNTAERQNKWAGRVKAKKMRLPTVTIKLHEDAIIVLYYIVCTKNEAYVKHSSLESLHVSKMHHSNLLADSQSSPCYDVGTTNM